MNNEPSPVAPPMTIPPIPPERRVGVLSGDRACHNCAFNLRGQPILRESHYDMIMLRCPECGAVAPILEYPMLSRWSRSIGALLMIGWVLVILLGLIALAGAVFGSAKATADVAVEPTALVISEHFIEFAKSQSSTPAYAGWANSNTQASAAQWMDSKWWEGESANAWAREAALLYDPWQRSVLIRWILSSIYLVPMAAILACFLPHLRVPRLLLVVPGIAVLTGIGMAIDAANSPARWAGGWIFASDAAHDVVGRSAIGLQIAAMLVLVAIGLVIGRRIGRLVVCWLIPPRQRIAFGFLWEADRLPQPGTR